jgi:hypothetical protein
MEYKDEQTGTVLPPSLLIAHTMADGTGQSALYQMNVNDGVGNSVYSFPGTREELSFPGATNPILTMDNLASDYLGGVVTTSIPEYGMGSQPWQRYDKFESRAFPLVYPSTSTYANATGVITNNNGNTDPFINFSLFSPGGNDLTLSQASLVGLSTNDTLIARTAIVPANVRIEASIFAEEGSFFIIPGPWFNPNPNDTRDAYNALIQSGDTALQADTARVQAYGVSADTPFYGEPLDIKIDVVGSVSENMPQPISIQGEALKKWGWIPAALGADGASIPIQHVPIDPTTGKAVTNPTIVPNFTISYDPELATGRALGFNATNNPSDLIRTDAYGRPLLPVPRLPVSPVLSYFGEVQ